MNANNNNANNNIRRNTAFTASTSRVNLVVLGNNAGFRQLCEDLRSNSSDLTDVSIWLRPCSLQYLTEFSDSMRENHTVQRFVIAASERFAAQSDLEQEARHLGRVVADNQNISKVTVVVHSLCRGLESFWDGVQRSQSLRVLTAVRFKSNGSLAPLVRKLTELKTFRYLFLKDCSLDQTDTQAISGLLEKHESSVTAFSLTNCSLEDSHKISIAQSIAKSNSLRFVRVEDSLQGPPGDAFGKAILENQRLIEAQFLSCCDGALESITNAMKDSVTLAKVKISAQKRSNWSKQAALEVSHTAKLNRRGRRWLREDAKRPKNASLEKTWLKMIQRDRANPAIVYSLIRDYPSIFVRSMNLEALTQLDNEKKDDEDSSSCEPLRKRRRVCDETDSVETQV